MCPNVMGAELLKPEDIRKSCSQVLAGLDATGCLGGSSFSLVCSSWGGMGRKGGMWSGDRGAAGVEGWKLTGWAGVRSIRC